MATFDDIDWSRLDASALISGHGIATITADDRQRALAWLGTESYVIKPVDFSQGLGPATATLNTLLAWEAQFGYVLDEEVGLDALRDGFILDVPVDGGLVLHLIGLDFAWQSNQRLAAGLLAVISEASRIELARGRRLFALVEVASSSAALVGDTIDTITVPYPARFRTDHAWRGED